MTILEVAIVILVLAILAAFLFPVFARVREYSGPTCFSNLKQIGLSLSEYVQDNDGRLPPRQASVGGKQISWRGIVYPYIRSARTLQCPTSVNNVLPDFENDGLPRSYAVNSTLGGSFGDDHPNLSISKIATPRDVILVAESTSGFGDFDPLKPGAFARQATTGKDAGCMRVHLSRSNFLFADGHVTGINPLLTIGAQPLQPNYWTIDNRPYSLTDRKTAQYTLGYAVEHGEKR